MNIYFIDPNNNTAQVNYPLLEELIKQGITIKYYTSYNRWDSEYYEQNYVVNSNIVFFRLANKFKTQKLRQILKGVSYPFNLLKLYREIKKHKPDILHFNNVTIAFFDSIFFSFLKRKNYTIVLTQHNFFEHGKDKISNLRLSTFNKADKIITLSSFTKNEFPHEFHQKIRVIKHGNVYEKEIDKYSVLQVEKNKGVITFLFIGLIRPYKGIELLIEAVKSLPENFHNRVELKIAGKAHSIDYLNKLLKLKEGFNNIQIVNKFLDYNEMISLIQESDVGVLPYLTATQSGVPYLFAGLQKPLIVTDVGALGEQVNTDFAEICSVNSEAISAAISCMLKRLEETSISSASFDDFNRKNKLSAITIEYINIYETLLSN
jgi:glycosyltransferase involved in cell wall biosynthesis